MFFLIFVCSFLSLFPCFQKLNFQISNFDEIFIFWEYEKFIFWWTTFHIFSHLSLHLHFSVFFWTFSWIIFTLFESFFFTINIICLILFRWNMVTFLLLLVTQRQFLGLLFRDFSLIFLRTLFVCSTQHIVFLISSIILYSLVLFLVKGLCTNMLSHWLETTSSKIWLVYLRIFLLLFCFKKISNGDISK